MTIVAFDTLEFARSPREIAKLTPEQAEGCADATAEALQGDLAAKSDGQALRSDLREDVQAVRSGLRELESRVKAHIGSIKADMLKWMVGWVGLQTLAILGAVLALARTLRP